MIIDDPEAFKSWLTAILEPLCDADPAALAKYVFALVKKDKPVADLRASMVEQLDVFLQSETKKFVDLLFKTLETQVYDVPATSAAMVVHHTASTDVAPVIAVEPAPAKVLVTKQAAEPILSESQNTANASNAQPVTGNQVVAGVTSLVNSVQTNGSISLPLHKRDLDLQARSTHRKSDLDKDDKGRIGGRNRHRNSRSPSRGRSRSRSWDRTRRSRSRDRDRERDRERVRERDRSRAWRNKSPPPRRYERDRRRSWSRSNSPPGTTGPVVRTRSMGNSRSRSRSPRYNHRGRYRNRSPPGRLSLSHSRSRSNERTRDKKDSLSGAGTPTQDSNHGDVDMRLTTTSQSIQSVVSAGGKTADSGANSGTTLLSGIYHAKRRCRDFDEKGYCMRGDLCPYDHGNDPVVLEDVALSRVLAFGPNHPPSHPLVPPGTGPPTPLNPPGGSQPPAAAEVTEGLVEHGPTPGIPLEPPPHHMPHPVPHPHMRGPHSGNMEYNPDAPSMEPRMWGRPPFRSGPGGMRAGGMMRGAIGRPVLYNPQPQRELISVPVTDQTHNYSAGYKRNRPTAETNNYIPNTESKESPPSKKKSNFDFARLGPRHKNPNNCSLELKKVPRGLNNITHLNNHFAKFGKIVNIQVSFEGDPEAALVTFSSHAEANAAYRSTEAVLNNRFIKVFWHNNSEGKQENVPPPRPSVKERLGVPNPVCNNKVLNTLQPKASLALQSEAVEKAAAAIKKTQEILAVKETLKKKQEEKRKEALKLTADLRKRKQDLLDKQLAQQKLLIERLEKGGVAAEQREALMTTIKKLQESIEKIRKDLASGVVQGATGTASTSSTGASRQQSAATPVVVKKSKEEASQLKYAQREILDAELDLFTRQQEGGDTSELQRKVAELKMEAHSLGLLQGSIPNTRLHHRSSVHLNRSLSRTARGSLFRGRGRGFTHVCVDHRPTKVLVSGYEEDEKTEVLAHFGQFGEIVDYIVDESTPSIILNYKSRKEAEVAMVKGRTFQDRLLSITWCSNPGVGRGVRGSHNLMSAVHLHHGLGHRSVIMVGAGAEGGEQLLEEVDEGLIEEEDELGVAELSEDVLLQDDEEEEEDGEDRSWRR
ncbi:RNA-binding protein 26-like isoform X3 [Zootermopsis nevadensis]|uniref:RNA-binding protein 26-like isoform X3 n=1 Tax=Zootermopsis nevadensis TaxID=136037 RepID=UPI000B8E3E01|nr:RNA-binding protein 26-like isoform X3 [Zootermopsis nevadensis]